ncbi:MAG: glycoside hydrolase family 2, partial [Chloroflexi bacterium]
DTSTLRVEVNASGATNSLCGINVEIRDGEGLVAAGQTSDEKLDLIVPLPNPKLWSPDSPHLYDLTVEICDNAGPVDRVGSYFGMRKFSLGRDGEGRPRLCLNNQPLFQYGPLDQGYWPEGLYTPPSDKAMLCDLELVKMLGCNMVRKHVKVEPARYYYHCDQLGLIVWQDMINGAKAVGNIKSFLTILFGSKRRDDKNLRTSGRHVYDSRYDYMRELREVVEHLYNFTCIGMWVPFNEGWGQFDARATAEWLKLYDPTRPIDHASGWFDQGGGDCHSLHVYFKSLPKLKPDEKRAAILSEFGGYSLKHEGHLWNCDKNFGYKKFKTSDNLTEAYISLLEKQLMPLIEQGLSGAVYTQLADVEIETNGFVSYDRAIMKMDVSRVREVHEKLLNT